MLSQSFTRSTTGLSFLLHYMDLPLPQANETTVAMCEDICRELLNQRRHAMVCAAVVRNRLLHTPGKLPDMETIAAELRA